MSKCCLAGTQHGYEVSGFVVKKSCDNLLASYFAEGVENLGYSVEQSVAVIIEIAFLYKCKTTFREWKNNCDKVRV